MKFTDGYWQAREGYRIQSPADIRDIRVEADAVTLYAATRKVRHKGDTLNAALLTVRCSSPMPDVIRVQYVRHQGGRQTGPHFPLFAAETKVEVGNDADEVFLQSGGLRVSIGKGESWRMEYTFHGKRLTGSGPNAAAHIENREGQTFFREQLDLGVGEYVYGLGERFTPFVKNGQAVDIWNADGGTSSEQAYKNVPFYLSNRGYGIFVRHAERVSFEIASEKVSAAQFSVPGETLDYFVIGGPSVKAVLENYTALTGKPALPPAWSFGLWLTTSFTTSYDEATVNRFVDGMAERDVPLRVFHFDCFWMKEYRWCDFEWDKDMFPDPEGMLRRLKKKGLKICVWINPYIAQKSPLFDEGMANGYLAMRPNGDVWQWDQWQAGMGLVDFTNPDATAWYQAKLKRLIDMGVDCFKTDFGERIPTDVVYRDGSDPLKMHNFYAYLYNKAVFEVLEANLGKNEAMLFARSATAGSQKFPVHWGGDCSANYDSMAETLRGGLSLGLSGFGFWSHDISGFERTAPPDIYKRWVAFGMLSSHSRLHGNESYRVPWLFGEEAVDVLRFFTKLKCRLMPYLFQKAVEAMQKGWPMMRAMLLEFPDDPTACFLDRQYMLGESLLVAPVFGEEGSVSFYLPEGRWTHFLSGRVVEGGRWLEESYDYMSLPLYARPSSIIPIGREENRPDYDFADGVEFQVFEVGDGKQISAAVSGVDGETELVVTIVRQENVMIVRRGHSDKRWSLLLRGVSAVLSVEGAAAVEASPLGVRVIPEADAREMIIRMEERT